MAPARAFLAALAALLLAARSAPVVRLSVSPAPVFPGLDLPTPAPEACEYEDAPINFDNFARGMPVRAGDGFRLKTRRLGPLAADDASAVFDSRTPTGFDFDLGAPNAQCGPATASGPGVGLGGVRGAPGENCVPLGNLLVAHQGDLAQLRANCAACPDCRACAPGDNPLGAEFEFEFTDGTQLDALVMLDLDEVPDALVLTDHTGRVSRHAGHGDNGKLVVPLGGLRVPAGGTFTIRCTGSCGIVRLVRARCLPAEKPPCLPTTVDFNDYKTGARVTSGADWTLQTTRFGFETSSVQDASAVFNTSSPTGNDVDLGAPNALCPGGGPGVGAGGAPGSEGANCAPLGQVLIAHGGDLPALRKACAACPRGARCAGCAPDDISAGARFKFTFSRAVRLGQMKIMDLDDAARSANIEMPDDVMYVKGLGDNSVQMIGLGWYDLAPGQSVTVTCAGSCAIVEFSYFPCF